MKKNLLIIPGMICFSFLAGAQISEGGLPLSFAEASDPRKALFDEPYQVYELLRPDMEAVHAEDLASAEKGRPYRVGINIPVSYNIHNSGTWLELPDGARLWRLGIHIPGANGLSLYFSERIKIPQGGRLHAYNERHSQYVGAYTSSTPSFYAMELIQGDLLTLEYYMPAGSHELPVIEIHEVAYYYRGFQERLSSFSGAGEITLDRAHGGCEVDAVCSEAGGWEDERNSALHYSFVDGGTYVCSATIVNNTAEDCTPFVITANHCGEPDATSDFNNHVWYFNYQRTSCSPGNTGKYSGAQSQTMSGGVFRASSELGDYPGSGAEMDGCDFVLCELETLIPTFYHAFYAGWTRSTAAATSGICFHHPAGDEKKISTYTTSLSTTTYNGGWAGAHWRVEWADTDNGWGVTEGGSSGSGLFNQDGHLVGHLSGGSSYCSAPTDPDLYGKFVRAWDLDGSSASSQLVSWLDPDGTGQTSIDGTYGACGQVAIQAFETEEINVYPNPTSNMVTVDLAGLSETIESIELRDINGRIITYLVEPGDEVVLTLEAEMAGVYYVKINTSAYSVVKKIVRL